MLIRLSIWWYKILSHARLDTVLLYYSNILKIDTLWGSENAKWPITQGGPLPDLVQFCFSYRLFYYWYSLLFLLQALSLLALSFVSLYKLFGNNTSLIALL
jgi:hypothetical protein